MAAKLNQRFLFSLFIALIVVFIYTNAARLSDPKILLPYHSSAITNFTLKINLSREEARLPDSCYTWQSTHQEVASIQLVNSSDGECAFSAVISAVSKSPYRKTSMVLAENKVTGEILRCIVIVEAISRFEIETTTRLLYLEDSPEELTIKGYDEEGNVFSSLAGLEFEWSLLPDTSTQGEEMVDILRITKFTESHYVMPYYIQQLEAKGLQGDLILVEGMRTGSAHVKARIRDGSYKDVKSPVVKLIVVANLIINPAEAYILKHATIKYSVQLIKQSSMLEISLPSSQFFLEVQEDSICALDAKTSIATGQEIGSTDIVLTDRNLKQDALVKPSAVLYVVAPSYLGFVVLPNKKWVLETEIEYTIVIEVFDKNSHKIYPSDNVMLKAMFPKEYFDVRFSTRNGTYHHVYTLKPGKTSIEGVLASIVQEDGTEIEVSPAVKGSRSVEIFDPIRVRPEKLYFPWDPHSPTSHQYKLQVKGGSGEYVWSSSNVETTTVNVKGEITTGKRGEAQITAADAKNRVHTGSTKVYVLPPEDMKFVPQHVEAVVGTELEMPLAVFGQYQGKLYPFNDCRKMKVNISFSDPTAFQLNRVSLSIPEEGCCSLRLKSVQRGHTVVVASYTSRGIDLSATVTIAAYDPLMPVDPEKEAVVAVGSRKELIFKGGPQPWIIDSLKYFQDLTSTNSAITKVQKVKILGNNRGFHNFYVTCIDFGEQELTLRVGNNKTTTNQFPAVAEASIRLSCSEPVGLQLHPDLKYPENLPPCPITKEQAIAIPIHCQRDLDIVVTVTDSLGRKFDNFSSLDFHWSVSDQSLATLDDSIDSSIQISTMSSKEGFNYIKYYRVLLTRGRPGFVVITASISSYLERHLKMAASPISTRIYPKISRSLELKLVEEAVVKPDIISLFNHPSNAYTVDVQRGSGFFHVIPDQAGVVKLDYTDKTKQMQVVPVTDGSMKVTVYDLCVYNRDPPTATIFVSGVGSVELSVTEKVEVDKEAKVKVRVMDAHGKPLQASFFRLMGLRLIPTSNIITIRKDKDQRDELTTEYYIMHGAQVGHTSLVAEARPSHGVVIRSLARPVEVFPPLQLIPRNITLIIGAKFQVLSRGGPTPQCTVLFSIGDSNIADVSSSGLLDAQNLGTTTVLGQAVGQDPETGETIIYSQDQVTVNVVELAGVRIHSALSRMQTGTKMPLYGIGLTEHETPFTFGSATPPLVFTWSINNKDVIQLQNVFHQCGLKHSTESDFARQLVAMSAGQVTVKLTVRPHLTSRSQVKGHGTLTDELQVEVFEKLTVISPKVCDGRILLTPNTEAVIKTNRDGSAKMSYHVISLDDPSPVTVGEGGLLTIGSLTGQVALHVTSQEEFGTNQTLVLLVKVKPVSYLMINSGLSLSTAEGYIKSIPVGTTLTLTVTYHDNVGEQFYATNVQMRYRLNRYDLVHIKHGSENDTLIVRAAEVGQSILKVWDHRNPWLADYINISVDYVITPSKVTVTLGTVVCFKSPLNSVRGYAGHWQSRSKVIDIDGDSGVSTSAAVGHSLVENTLSQDVTTYTEVTVQPIDQLTVDDSWSFLTNVKNRLTEYFITVSLNSDSEVIGENCTGEIQAKNFMPTFVPITCELVFNTAVNGLSVSDLFQVSATFSSKKGKYGCLVKKLHPETLVQQISTMSVDLQLSVLVPNMENQLLVMAPVKKYQYLPPFYVHNSEVLLSTAAPLSSIRVSTIPDLSSCIQAAVSDEIILEVMTPEKDSQSGTILIFPVRLVESASLWDRESVESHVELSCRKTGQKVRLPVSVRLIGQRPEHFGYRGRPVGWGAFFVNSINNNQSLFSYLFLIIATAVAVLVAYHYVIGPRYKAVANTNPAFLRPGAAGAASPPSPMYPQLQFSPNYSPPPYTSYASPLTSPKSPALWSTEYHPQDGSSPRRRSPYRPSGATPPFSSRQSPL
ncbi:nuclear pore membrane glycoprotein 210-like isoform X2 [Ostrea edulis]|uniref:nuclear pore membrane glycoprotein 210-like isoform X2 n=1 Tax=Ostrea edulis TaxID=37623 RepID=UPI0024AF5465|nr:nuclear pore membrane glycoprotein 210-like isoform X2 [Ostrea edulis]